MDNFFLAIALVLSFLVLICLYRAVFGPTVIDRIISVGVVGTKTLLVLLLMGLIYKRMDMFVDISLLYAILSFIGALIFAKYFVRKGVL
ncbi:MAG: pH regulation protein F [Deltaproteobacteria bacterium CG12_big_fil_rev_8_21_14_0_65_43_10]|nr:MAG: pH regulation protein F [Deltaproteobacteria bacterium CG2_30_43_15]PIQ46456.1 MAG: pH regulation protein F [Deltaproteobacteria bacterium CG12_big_fil_rev_8_21_14_0_65_43_10]PIU86054.1 MAG: pH regulation protein F [Deltaproteobacteria bacterium CG06_land_8_20_14_3_00_44_19]PIX23081.1 MAG: pH regulation protein F [Deltaproteobacteria bacterium CG_4_8_14_3_um_filter_43_13]PIZ18759.1 MAG: pH regulation protein F [Deltaproteobacteria bacterium CG_4_10_14_0_8_um_filter_43_12]PJB39599.1 MAG